MSSQDVPTSKEELTGLFEQLLSIAKGAVEDVRIGRDDLGASLDIIIIGDEKADLMREWLPYRIKKHRVIVYCVPPMTQEDHIKQVVGDDK